MSTYEPVFFFLMYKNLHLHTLLSACLSTKFKNTGNGMQYWKRKKLKHEIAQGSPGGPSDLHSKDTNPAHTGLEHWRGNLVMAERSTASVIQVTSLNALWTPRCTLCFGSAMGHCFPASILPQHPCPQKHWKTVIALEHNNPQTFLWKQEIPIVLTQRTQ